MNIRTSLFASAALIAAVCSCGNGGSSNNTKNEIVTEPLDSIEIKYAPVLAIGSAAPEISAPDSLGQIMSLSDFKGSYVVVDFWATWCPDCRNELPDLKAVYDEYKDKKVNGKKVEFLSVSFDRDEQAWKKMVREEGLVWNQIADIGKKWKESPITNAYSLGWIPTFYLIGPDGKIVASGIKAFRMGEALKGLE